MIAIKDGSDAAGQQLSVSSMVILKRSAPALVTAKLRSVRLVKDAIRNLIENAVRHGRQGVEVSVSIEAGPSVMVADDGVGFADERSSAGPARRSRRQGGRGIGLEIVRRIAEMHDAPSRSKLGRPAELSPPEAWRDCRSPDRPAIEGADRCRRMTSLRKLI